MSIAVSESCGMGPRDRHRRSPEHLVRACAKATMICRSSPRISFPPVPQQWEKRMIGLGPDCMEDDATGGNHFRCTHGDMSVPRCLSPTTHPSMQQHTDTNMQKMDDDTQPTGRHCQQGPRSPSYKAFGYRDLGDLERYKYILILPVPCVRFGRWINGRLLDLGFHAPCYG